MKKSATWTSQVFVMTITTLFALLAVEVPVAQASLVFNVFRLLQSERGGVFAGSQTANVNLVATSDAGTRDLNRKVVVVDFAGATNDHITDLIVARHASGVIVVVPKDVSTVDANALARWTTYARKLETESIDVPFYFAHAEGNATELQSALASNEVTDDDFQIVITGREKQKLPVTESANIQSWLAGAQERAADGTTSALPTVVLLAHYDAAATAPGLAYGADASGSGVVALLSLARAFGRLYSSPSTHAAANLLFLLTAAGEQGFVGAQRWITDNADSSIMKSIHVVLCLDGLGRGTSLTVHVPKAPTEDPYVGVIRVLTASGQRVGTTVDVVRRKANVSADAAEWEHERFSHKRVSALTISHIATSQREYATPSIFDNIHNVDRTVLRRNIRVIGEAVARYVFASTEDDIDVLSDADFDTAFEDAWLEVLGSTARFGVPADAPIVKALESTLRNFAAAPTDTSVQKFKLESSTTHYEALSTGAIAYRTKRFWFDFLILGAVVVYLLGLHVLLGGMAAVHHLLETVGLRQRPKWRKS